MKQIFIYASEIGSSALDYAKRHKYRLFRIASSVPSSEFIFEKEFEKCIERAAELNCVEYCFVAMTQHSTILNDTIFCRIDILGFAKE